MIGFGNLAVSFRVTVVVLPVAFYFLVLGLLNSRKNPQLLSGRFDFSLLAGAFSPMFILPAVEYFGGSLAAAAAFVGILSVCLIVLAPRGRKWVIYNLHPRRAFRVVAQCLDDMNLAYRMERGVFRLDDGLIVQVRVFPLLRNVSICMRDSSVCNSCVSNNSELAHRFEKMLCRSLANELVPTSPATVALLLVATAMMVLPLTLMASQASQLARILGDLLK